MRTFNPTFDKDLKNCTIVVTSQFNAPLSVIWNAFTHSGTLEKWWAPKPYKAVTKTFDFREGGRWLYYMLAPDGKKFWSIQDYKSINPQKSYEVSDAFSDENGNIDTSLSRTVWKSDFSENSNVTTVTNTITFKTEADMQKLLEMGFEEGYKIGLKQLKELLESEK